MKRSILFASMALVGGAIALSATVKGRILDSSNSPQPGATVQIYQLPDSVRKGFLVTGAKGDFALNKIKPGKYSLKVTLIGMQDIVKHIDITDANATIDLGNLPMSEEATMLGEAVVKGIKTAVVAKQDTIEFNAGSFKTQANASVEDLLKKLPGVEVDSDGKITSGGKSISKILVDGKEFFGGDTQMATKNLPSDLVDKVQVVDRKSDLARLTGVDDGEDETVINLTVKKSMKNGWFGTLGAGYGTDGRYEGKFNISTFTDNNQISIVGGGNNINDLGFGDSGRGRFNGFGGGGGITTAQRIGLNFNVGRTDSLRFGGNVFYAHSDRNSLTNSTTLYKYGGDKNQLKKSESLSTDIGHNVQGDFRMEWKMDKNNTLDFRPSFSFNKRDAESSSTSNLWKTLDNTQVNSDLSRRYNNGIGYDLGGRLIFNHNFESRPGRSFSLQGNYNVSNTFQNNTSWSKIEQFLKKVEDGEADVTEYYRYMDNRQTSNTVGGRLSYTEPLGDAKNGNFLQVSYRMNLRFNNADLETYTLPFVDLADVTNWTSKPANAGNPVDSLSNIYDNTFNSHELAVGYKKVNKMYNLDAGLMWSPSGISRVDKINTEKSLSNWAWTNIAPYARFQYKFDKTTSLRADYRARANQPSISQLQPVADVTDPMNIVQGNPNLKPSFGQNLGIHFNGFDAESQRSINAMLNGSFTMNSVISKTITDLETGRRTTTYENANGNWSTMGMLMLNQPFGGKMWRYSVRAFGNYNESVGYINGVFNRAGSLNLRPSVGLTFTNDLFQISVNPNYGYQLSTNTMAGQPNRWINSYGLRSDAALFLPFGLSLNTDFMYSHNPGFSSTNPNPDSYLWNAQLSYSMLKDKSLTLSVRAYDILGMKKNYFSSSNDQYDMDTQYNDLTRYVMFGISYTFNTMKSKKAPENDGFMEGPGMHGGRRGPGGFGGPGGGMRPF